MFVRLPRLSVALSGTLLLVSLVAGASLQPAQAAPAGLSSAPTPIYQTNGRVATILVVRNTVYIGGDFTAVRPPGAAPGTQEVARSHVAAFRVDTGKLRAWNPHPNGPVSALAPSADGRTLYIGGTFTRLGGALRHNLGAVAFKTSRATPFHANADGAVLALRRSHSRLYVGGSFGKVKGETRHHVAAVDLHGHGKLVRSWHPRPNSTVRSIRTAAHGKKVYLGGEFSAVNNHAGAHLAKVSAASGRLLPWRHHPDFSVWSIVAGRHRVYAGGNGAGGHIVAYSPRGARAWRVDVDGGVQAMAGARGGLIVGGHFRNVCNGMIGANCAQVTASRNKLLMLNTVTGGVTSWNPTANSGLGVFALANISAKLYVGGVFTKVNNLHQQGLVCFRRS